MSSRSYEADQAADLAARMHHPAPAKEPQLGAFLSGERIVLRGLLPTDLGERYLRWLNDPRVTRFLETGRFPTRVEDLEHFYRNVAANRDNVVLAIVDRQSGLHIGNVRLGPIEWIHRTATLGILIGESEFWGRGYASETCRLVSDYAFARLNLRKILMGVYACHRAAIRAYEKAGFQVEAVLRAQLFLEGSYHDKVLMSRFAPGFKPHAAESCGVCSSS